MKQGFGVSKGAVAAVTLLLLGLAPGAQAVPACVGNAGAADALLCPNTATGVQATCIATGLYIVYRPNPVAAGYLGSARAFVTTSPQLSEQQDAYRGVSRSVAGVTIEAEAVTSSCKAQTYLTNNRLAFGYAQVEDLTIDAPGVALRFVSLESWRFWHQPSGNTQETSCVAGAVVVPLAGQGYCPPANTGLGGTVSVVLNERWTVIRNGIELRGGAAAHIGITTPSGMVHVYAGYVAIGLPAHV